MESKKLSPEKQALAEKHHNLIYSFLNMYHLKDDDWYDIVAIGYMKAVHTYDPSIGGFSTYAYLYMKYAVGNGVKYIKRACRAGNKCISYDDPNNEWVLDTHGGDDNAYKKACAKELFQRVNEYLLTLDERKRKTVLMTARGYKSPEIAEATGRSPSAIRDYMFTIRKNMRAQGISINEYL